MTLRSIIARRYFSASVNKAEIDLFDKLSTQWWDPYGPSAMLHRMNPARVSFIKDCIQLAGHEKKLNEYRVLDIGCGAGILTESLARLGCDVLGVDASSGNINAAMIHKQKDFRLRDSDKLKYVNGTAEELAEEGKDFDIVCAMEILEHVKSPATFINTLSKLLKPNGLLFVSTINRTPAAYATGIIMAEKILKWVPEGTHHFDKFIRPDDLCDYCVSSGLKLLVQRGIRFDPLRKQWNLSEGFLSMEINYIQAYQKLKQE
ncbi:hypothetical protein MP638_004509 [Amoeboaphelidium occidentale]|nr:hypothetical protein MP638_004509 [Amoeboaphelidium occidentale]